MRARTGARNLASRARQARRRQCALLIRIGAVVGAIAAAIPVVDGLAFAGGSPTLADVTPAGVTVPDHLAASGSTLYISDDGPSSQSGSQIVALDTTADTATTAVPTGWYSRTSGPAALGDGFIRDLAPTATGAVFFTQLACGGGQLFLGAGGGGAAGPVQQDFPAPNGECANGYGVLTASPDGSTLYAVPGPNVTDSGSGYNIWTSGAATAGDSYGLASAGNDAAPPIATGALVNEQLVGNRLYLLYTSGIAVQNLDGSSCAVSGPPTSFCALTGFRTGSSTAPPADGSPLSTPAFSDGWYLAVDGAGDVFVLTYGGFVIEAGADGLWHDIATGSTAASAGAGAASVDFGFSPGGIATVGTDVYVTGVDASFTSHVWKIPGIAATSAPESEVSTVAAWPTAVPTGSTRSSLVTVTLSTGALPLAGDTVTLTASGPTSAVIAQVGSGVSDTDGQVQFRVTDNSAETVTLTARDVTAGVTLPETVAVQFVQPTLTPAMTLTATPSPVGAGGTAQYTATVTGTTAGGAPTGPVTFVQDGTVLCAEVALTTVTGAKASASCPASYPTIAGSPHTVTASYEGDTTYKPKSASTSEAVQSAVATVTVTSDDNPAIADERVTYSAAVSGTAGTPTGTVTFFDGSGAIVTCGTNGTVAVVAGMASCPVDTGPSDVGTHSISASYSGDGAYGQAGSNTMSEQVLAGYGADYVALGDSYSAGEGDGSYGYGSETDSCDRSPAGYPALLDADASLGTMAFVACSGAETTDLFNANHTKGNTSEAAQLCGAPGAAPCPAGVTPWLGPDTKVVTLTIGGNDVGFSSVLSKCVQAAIQISSVKIWRFGKGICLNNKSLSKATAARINALAGTGKAKSSDKTKIYPLATVLGAIHAAAPRAHVYVGLYPALFETPASDTDVGTIYASNLPVIGSAPLDGFVNAANAAALDALGTQLDTAIYAVTSSVGSWATPVNAAGTSGSGQFFDGHGFDSSSNWFNPMAVNDKYPSENPWYVWPGSFHPTAAGQQQGFEAAFLQAIGH